jgi:hypothetical protein
MVVAEIHCSSCIYCEAVMAKGQGASGAAYKPSMFSFFMSSNLVKKSIGMQLMYTISIQEKHPMREREREKESTK